MRHAELAGDQGRQFLAALGQLLGDRGAVRGAVGGREIGPARLSGRCRAYGCVDIRGESLRHSADGLLGRRIDDLDQARTRGRHPAAVDEELLPADVTGHDITF